ncbi:hypothetical protein [Hymenobacter lucidus]|uniref:DUF4349 domain-containing protein n=1 Tax=Hymenobacter lucidus TaxID=2880930 RepID=A0ABS8AXK9_9BACT|nr:hypothetical protein [Hymenobacter lucidus]MCB2410556.1 hypothetical protein [Hymenobacter lucidus]
MMRTIQLTFFLILLLLANQPGAHAQEQQWQKVKLNGSTTVAFPEPAEKKEVQGQQTYNVRSGNNTYIVTAQKDAFDSDPELADQQKFYDSVLEGAMSQLADAQLVAKRPFEKNGFVGLEAQFNTALQTDIPQTLFMRIILVDGTLFIQNFVTSVNVDQAAVADQDRFFNSFQTSARKTAYAEPGTHGPAYAIGKLMGRLVVYGGLLALVIFLIRRFSKSKKEAKV